MDWESISFTHFRVNVFRNGFDLVKQLPEITSCISEFLSDEYKTRLGDGTVYSEDVHGSKVLTYDDIDKAFLLQSIRDRGFLTRIDLVPFTAEGISVFKENDAYVDSFSTVEFRPSLTVYSYGVITLSVDIILPRLPINDALEKMFSEPFLNALEFVAPRIQPYNAIEKDLRGRNIESYRMYFNMLSYTISNDRIAMRFKNHCYNYQLLDTVYFLEYKGGKPGVIAPQLSVPESGRITIFPDGLSILITVERKKHILIREGISKVIRSILLDGLRLKTYSLRILNYGLSLLHAYDVMQGDIKRVARSYRGGRLKRLRYMQEKLFRYEWGYVDLIDFASVVLPRSEYMTELKSLMGIPQRISETNDLLNHYRYGLSGIVGSYETKRSYALGVFAAVLTFLMALISILTGIDFYLRYIK